MWVEQVVYAALYERQISLLVFNIPSCYNLNRN